MRASHSGPALRDLDLTSNQVFGLAMTDEEWSAKLESAITASRRDDLQHGTNSAYIHSCVCKDCGSTSSSGWPRTVAEPQALIAAPGADQPPAVADGAR
jgi:hypothetical protein